MEKTSDDERFGMAMRAFDLMALPERERVLTTMAGLRYPSVRDRFHESVYREIVRQEPAEPTEEP